MKLPRPYIPLEIRCKVALRQLGYVYPEDYLNFHHTLGMSYGELLGQLLDEMKESLGCNNIQLDHNPALALRKFNKRTGKYKPDANDPNYLVYRPKDDHRTKTFIRGEHGQRSDVAQITRERKRARPKKPSRKMNYRRFDGTPVWATRERG